MIRAVALTALLLLAACGEKKAEPAKQPDAAPLPLTKAKAMRSVAYVCEKDMPVTAIYGTDAEGKADVALIVKDMDLRLTEAKSDKPKSDSGQRFTSTQGLEAGNGVIWVTDGETALLQRAPLDKLDDPTAASTVRSCKLKSEPSPAPKTGG